MDNLANKENSKRIYFTRDHIKLISPSTQMLGLENKDIQFYVKHYGNSEKYMEYKMRQLEDNQKFFMGQVQPLVDENLRLKDTIINLSEALKCKQYNFQFSILTDCQQLILVQVRQFDGQGNSREIQLQFSNVEKLIKFISEDRQLDENQINELLIQIEQQNQEMNKLKSEIVVLTNFSETYRKQRDLEFDQKLNVYIKKDLELQQQYEDMKNLYEQTNNDIMQRQLEVDKSDKQIQFLHAQIMELKKKIEEVQRNLVMQDKKAAMDKQEVVKKYQEDLRQIKFEGAKDLGELRQRSINKQNEILLDLKLKDEQIEDLQGRVEEEIRKRGWEVQQLDMDYKKICTQYEELKISAFQNLNSLAQVMVEKREKETQLNFVEEQLMVIQEEQRKCKLSLLESQQKMDEMEDKYKLLLSEQNQKYQQHLNNVLEETNLEKDQTAKKHVFEVQKIKGEFENEIQQLDLKRCAQIDEQQVKMQSLINQLEDTKIDLKALEEQWNFKYVTMEIKLSRQIESQERAIQSDLNETARKLQNQLEVQKKDLFKKHNDEVIRLEDNIQALKSFYIKQMKEQDNIHETKTVYLASQLQQVKDEYTQLQKRTNEQISKALHDNTVLQNSIKNYQLFHQDEVSQLELQKNDKVSQTTKSLYKQIAQQKEGYELKIDQMQRDHYKLNSRVDELLRENEQYRSELEDKEEKATFIQTQTTSIGVQTNQTLVLEQNPEIKDSSNNEQLLIHEIQVLIQKINLYERRIQQFEAQQQITSQDNEDISQISKTITLPPQQTGSYTLPPIHSNSNEHDPIRPLSSSKPVDSFKQQSDGRVSSQSNKEKQGVKQTVILQGNQKIIKINQQVTKDQDQRHPERIQSQELSNQHDEKVQKQPKGHATSKKHDEKAHKTDVKIQKHDANVVKLEGNKHLNSSEPTSKQDESNKNTLSQESQYKQDEKQPNKRQTPDQQKHQDQKQKYDQTSKHPDRIKLNPISHEQNPNHEMSSQKTDQTNKLSIESKQERTQSFTSDKNVRKLISKSSLQINEFDDQSIEAQRRQISNSKTDDQPILQQQLKKTEMRSVSIQTSNYDQYRSRPAIIDVQQDQVIRKDQSQQFSQLAPLNKPTEIFDNEAINERIKDDQESKYNLSETQFIKQEYFLQQANSVPQQVITNQHIIVNRRQDLVIEVEDQKQLKEEILILRLQLKQFQDEEVPRIAGYYENQIQQLIYQIQQKDEFIQKIQQQYEDRLSSRLYPQKDELNDQHGIQQIVNNQDSQVLRDFETYKSLQEYQNSEHTKQQEELRERYQNLQAEKENLLRRLNDVQTIRTTQGQNTPTVTGDRDSRLKPIFTNQPQKNDRNFLSKPNREFITMQRAYQSDFGDQIDLSYLVELQQQNRSFYNGQQVNHALSPIQPRFVHILRPPRAKLNLSDSWERLPNYFVDKQTRELKTQINARDKKILEIDQPLLSSIKRELNQLAIGKQQQDHEENQLNQEMRQLGSQLRQRISLGEEIGILCLEKKEPSVRSIDHMDPRQGLHSGNLKIRQRRVQLPKRALNETKQEVQNKDFLITGFSREGGSQHQQRSKNPGFIDFLKIKKDTFKNKQINKTQQKSTWTQDAINNTGFFLNVKKAISERESF